MTRKSLRGRRVLLTGASTGIGRVLARLLADEGAVLAVAARRESLLEELADEIAAAGNARPETLGTDLSRSGAAGELAEQAVRALGGVDLLINNAGASAVGAQSALADGGAARASFEINFWAPVALAAALSPAMREQGEGTIVNVTSTVQSVPLPLVGYYSATKAALAQATRSMRHELRHTPIRVIEVVPGSTDTTLRDIDQLPWIDGRAPRTFPPVRPESVARSILRAIQRGRKRLAFPRYSLLPLEIPVLGRIVAALGARRIDAAGAVHASGRR